MGRHDDLWSLFYMLIEFLQGKNGWQFAVHKILYFRTTAMEKNKRQRRSWSNKKKLSARRFAQT